MQSINTILKYHTCEKNILNLVEGEKNLHSKYYGGGNMMKNKQKVKAACRLKVECSKMLDRGLLGYSLMTDAIVISRGENIKLK